MKRRVLTLQIKLDIIEKFENSATNSKISQDTGLPDSTVRSINKMKHKIKSQGVNVDPSMTKISTVRSYAMENMERLLVIWIDDCMQKLAPLSSFRSKFVDVHYSNVTIGDVFVRFQRESQLLNALRGSAENTNQF